MATGGVPAFALPDGFSAEGPFAQWHQWFAEAETFGAPEPAAAVVSTIGDDGFPDARFVLVRGVDDRGFVFYTNFESAKSRHLDAVPHASLVAGWLAQQRSIRVRGSVVRVDPAEADAYFAGRPRGSQIGAWASRQSSVLADRAELEASDFELTAPGRTAPPRASPSPSPRASTPIAADSSFAQSLADAVSMPYTTVPHWPPSRVEGHEGRLVVGTLGGRTVAALAGR